MTSILQKPWLLPALSIIAASSFIGAHLASQGWSHGAASAGSQGTVETGRESVGGGGLLVDAGGLRPFTYVPTAAPHHDADFVPVPTTVVIGHHVPAIDDAATWNVPEGEPTPDPVYLVNQNAPTKLSWNIPPGEPTPDPAMLHDPATDPALISRPNDDWKWNIPKGQPTPDPVLWHNPAAEPTVKVWNVPKGRPTPDPALLNNPATPPASYSNVVPGPTYSAWNIPKGQPTPDPARLNDPGTPPFLKAVAPTRAWNIPDGRPTPDPALLMDPATPPFLKSVPNSYLSATYPPFNVRGDDSGSKRPPPFLSADEAWNIPDGQPTPDPALLRDPKTPPALVNFKKWNIPQGEPTPDPAMLSDPATPPSMVEIPPTHAKRRPGINVAWAISPGEPTPDPALLNDPATPPAMIKGCDYFFEDFSATVLVDYEVNTPPESIPQSELETLSQAFVQEYNTFSQTECDPLFRTIDSAITVPIVDHGRQLSQRGRRQLKWTVTFQVSIKGNCRGQNCGYKVAGTGVAEAPPADARQHLHVQGLFSQAAPQGRRTQEQEVDSNCACKAEGAQYRPPTEVEMLQVYNTVATASPSIVSATQLTQVLVMPGCDDVSEDYAVDLIMEVESADPAVSHNELNALSASFIADYNDLTTHGCDSIFRRSTNATVTIASARRRLGPGRQLGTFVLTGKATIKGTCKGFGCSSEVTQLLRTSTTASSGGSNSAAVRNSKATGLFAKRMATSGRRLLSSNVPNVRAVSRSLQAGLSPKAMECYCPSLNPELEAPTTTEMVKKYDLTVKELALPNINGIGEIVQIFAQACKKEENPFSAVVLIDYKVKDPSVTGPDISALTASFATKYNEIAEGLCDPMYRRLTEVSMTKLASRKLDDGSGSWIVTFKAIVNGNCHGVGCQDEVVGSDIGVWVEGIFGVKPLDGERRRLAARAPDDCLCSSDRPKYRPPMKEEMEASYSAASAVLSGNILAVTNVMQVLVMPGCDDITETFDVTMMMEVETNSLEVSSSELGNLGSAFLDDYNDMSTNGCDAIFRRTSNATVSIENIRRKLGGRNLGTFVVTGKAMVKGQCKGFGCSAKVTKPDGTTSGSGTGSNAAAVAKTKASGLFAQRAATTRRLSRAVTPYQSLSRSLQLALSVDQMTCYCPDLNPQLRPPTADEMVVVYNETVSALPLPSVKGIAGISQVTEQSCPQEREEFGATVIIDFEVLNPILNDEEVAMLGDAFTFVYNEYSASLCDSLFRRISKTTLLNIGSTRRLVEENAGQKSRRLIKNFVLSFEANVTGVCHGPGCTKKVLAAPFSSVAAGRYWEAEGLFSPNEVIRRRLSGKNVLTGIVGSSQWGECECAPQINDSLQNSSPQSMLATRPPTTEEMLFTYNKTATTAVVDVVRVVRIYQATVMEGCEDTEEHFEAMVMVDVKMRNPSVSNDELRALGASFITDYNELATLYCDPLFRRLTSATFHFINSAKRLEDSKGVRQLAAGTFVVNTQVVVKGTCKGVGCSNMVTLQPMPDAASGNASAIRNAQAKGLFGMMNAAPSIQGPAKGDCFCPSINPEYRPPSAVEMSSEYNTTVWNLKLPAVIEIVKMTQVYSMKGCDAILEEYEAFLVMEVGANSSDIRTQERHALESVFIDQFNFMAAENCDPDFRRVANASLVIYRARRLQPSELDGRTKTFVLTGNVKVKGVCRGLGCGTKIAAPVTATDGSISSGLFAKVAVRRIETRQLIVQNADNIDTGDCFCGSMEPLKRPPTTSELVVAYNATIAALNLPTVESIIGVTEIFVEPTPAPVPKWNIDPGQPTPDPALQLVVVAEGVPTVVHAWGIPLGEPTPDPAILPPNTMPIILAWGIPDGYPTPDPALLVKYAGSPIVSGKFPPPHNQVTRTPTGLGETRAPTRPPSSSPSSDPSPEPSTAPSTRPVPVPSHSKNPLPTSLPTPVPTPLPTQLPTPLPTPLPTVFPTSLPSPLPTAAAVSAIPQVVVVPQVAPVPQITVTNETAIPWWNNAKTPTTSSTSLPLVTHNEKFLEGCDPRQCVFDETTTFHSLSNEDEAIYELFYTNPIKCCLVIVEIGVGDGNRFTASKFFEDGLKWKSLLIESDPGLYNELQANRPNAATEFGAFCEADHMMFDNGNYHALGGSVEVSSELHLEPVPGATTQQRVPCLKMDSVFAKYSMTHVDVMIIRVRGDALAFIRSMDWTVRVDIWIVLMHGASVEERDNLVRSVLFNNEYVRAEWDVKRWCGETTTCLANEVFLRKGFDCELAGTMKRISRNLRGS